MIRCPIQFESIMTLSFSVSANEHGWLTMSGYVEASSGDSQISKDLEGKPLEIYSLEGKPAPIFIGQIRQAFIHQTNQYYIAEIWVSSFSAKLDVEKKCRSFQNVDMTYADVIQAVLQDTPDASATFSVGMREKIRRPILQYQETDWEFIKRLSSELEVCVFPDYKTISPQISIGLTGATTGIDLTDNEYICKVDKRFYTLGGQQAGLQKVDFLCHEVRDKRNINVGDTVLWTGANRHICKQTAELVDSELIFTYTLGLKGLVGNRPYQNKRIIGLSLPGTVKSTFNEQLTLLLDIDKGRNPGSYPFPWRPESGNIMYCMPKVGTRVSLFFQDSDGGSAIALSSPRENGETCAAMSDPSMRCFTSEHSKQLFLYPESMGVIAGTSDAPIQINMDQLNQLLIESSKLIQMTAKLNVRIVAPIVNIRGPQDIQVNRSAEVAAKCELLAVKGTACGNPPTGGGSTNVLMSYQFDLLGAQGVIWGTEFHTFPAFNDAPNEFDRGGWLCNILFGALVVAACVLTALAFPAVAPIFIGAAIGATVTTAAIAVADAYSGNVRDAFEAQTAILLGTLVGAAIAGTPYIPAGLQAIESAIADFAATTFMIPPLLPGLAGVSGGAAVLNGGLAISGQAIINAGLQIGAVATGVAVGNALSTEMIAMTSGNSPSNQPHKETDSDEPSAQDPVPDSDDIEISDKKMWQLGSHYWDHGREMGYGSKTEYDLAAKEFAKAMQSDPSSSICEGIWNGRGQLNGTVQRVIINGNKAVIIDKATGQIIDFYYLEDLRGLIHIVQIR